MENKRKTTKLVRDTTERRAVLDERKKELMLAIFLRNQKAFEAAREVLTYDRFGRYDRGMATVWKIAETFWQTHHALPDFQILHAEVDDACASDPELLSEVQLDALRDFINFTFDTNSFQRPVETDETYADWAIKTCQQFLDERLAVQVQETIKTRDQIAVNVTQLLTEFHAVAARVSALTTQEASLVFEEGWDREAAISTFPTNVAIVDRFLSGGHAGGELYGLLGPYGSCKTTVVAMLATEAAKYFNALAKRSDKPDGDDRPLVAFWFSYEARHKEMLHRALGYTAQISRRTLEPMKSIDSMSRSSKLKDYEKKLFLDRQRKGATILGEFERTQNAIPILQTHLCCKDMTGHRVKGVGGGGIAEIAHHIHQELRSRNARCGAVFIDYVGAMAKRFIMHNDYDLNHMRHLIGGAPLEAKSKIADIYNCPVWLVHQLSGEANKFSAAKLPDHTDAAEAKNFAENLDFCMSASKPNNDGIGLFGCTKHRRTKHLVATVIKIDGEMYRVRCVDDKYVLNTQAKQIIPRSENERLPEGNRQVSNVALVDAGNSPDIGYTE